MLIVKQLRFIPRFAALFLLLMVTACGVPGSKNVDTDIKNATIYHQNNGQCENVNVSETNFTPASLRSLVSCFNSKGQIPELNTLVQSSRDEELAPITEFLSRTLFTRPNRLYQIEHTLQLLDQRGLLQENFQALSRLLNNGDFVTNAVHVLNHGYFSSVGGIMDYITNGFAPSPNDNLLGALEELGKELTDDRVAQALDFGLTLADARATQSFLNRFRSQQNAASHQTLSAITHPLIQFLVSGSQPGRVDLGKQTLTLLSQGPLWEALDRILPESPQNGVQRLVPQWSRLVTTLYREEGRFFRDAPELFNALSETAEHPIACMRGASRLSNLTPSRVLSEIDHVTLKEFLTSLVVARPFCEFPQAILEGAASFMPIAASDASDTLETWVRAFNSNQQLVSFMVNLLSERDSFIGHVPALLSEGSRLRHLSPLVTELNDRGAWNDALLIASLFKVTDRPALNQAIQALIEPRPALNQGTIYDAVAAVLPRVDEGDIQKLIISLQPYIDEDQKIGAPFLRSVRSAYYANNVHPGIDFVRETLLNARQNKEFFTALFKIVGRNGSQFGKVVSEVAHMARQDDGRLKELTLSFLRMFHHYSERSPSTIIAGVEPQFVPRSRHNLVGSELLPLPSRPARPNSYQACNAYDFNFSLADYGAHHFTESFTNLTQCLAFHEEDADVERSLNFVSNATLMGGALQGRSLLAWSVDAIRGFAGAEAAVSELTERFLNAVTDHSITATLDAFPHWVKRTTGTTVAHGNSLLDPLLRLLGQTVDPLAQTLAETPAASATRRDALLRSKTASICTLIRQARDEDTDVEPTPVISCETLPVEQALRNQLAIWEPTANADTRVPEIIDEFLNAVEHDFTSNAHRATQNNHLLTSWTDSINSVENLLLEKVSRVYTYLVNPREQNEDPENLNTHKVLEGMLSFPKSINGAMNQFHHDLPSVSLSGDRAATLAMSDFFASWMVEQANILLVYPYYYQGDLIPRVRLTSNLDRLGMILENTDAIANGGMEPVVMGLNIATSAWSDEAPEDRPAYARNATNSISLSQLASIFQEGLPEERNCLNPSNKQVQDYNERERTCVGRLRNLKGWVLADQDAGQFPRREQPAIVSVFESFLPANRQCTQPTDCFGLKMIRNLFTGLREKTPLPYQRLINDSGFIGQRNNVKVMQALAKTGAFRYGTKLLFGQNPQDPSIRDLFRTLTLVSQSPSYPLIETFLKTLLDPSESGSWSASQQTASRGFVRRAFDLVFHLNQENNTAIGPIGIYGSATMASLQLLESPTDVAETVVKVLTGAVSPQGGRAILAENIDAPRALLGSAYTATLLRTLYNDSTSASTSQWSQFRQGYIALQNDPHYPKADVARLINEVIDFLHHPPRAGEAGNALYQQALKTLLQQVSQGHTEELLKLLARNPDEVHGLLETLARFERQGHARELVDMIGRLMEPVPAAQR